MLLPRIFIGGTGRSGTWILYKSLSCHNDIQTFPGEMRFLIDPGGLKDLVFNLTINYAPASAREALFNFERLMRVYLATPGKPPYAAIDLPKWLGEDYYWSRLNQFCFDLTDMAYKGHGLGIDYRYRYDGRLVAWAKRVRDFRLKIMGEEPVGTNVFSREIIRDGKYFSERHQLISLTADFVDELFLHAAHARGRKTWSEKTPQHLLHLDFIWELFPESLFIHIKRDPRGVAYSLMKQPWGPNNLEGACIWLKNIYQRWFDLSKSMNLSTGRYLEIKLEEFALSPEDFLKQITSCCGLEYRFSELPEISLEKANYWEQTMTHQEVELVNEILGPYIEKLGYRE